MEVRAGVAEEEGRKASPRSGRSGRVEGGLDQGVEEARGGGGPASLNVVVQGQ